MKDLPDKSLASNQGRVARRRARVRADLLAAARHVFTTHGYQDATIAQVTQFADVATGTFYLQFQDKEELFVAVVEQGLQAAQPEETDLHEKIVNRVERELVVQVLQSCNNVQTKAATRLGINRNTLRSKLQQYNLEESDDAKGE